MRLDALAGAALLLLAGPATAQQPAQAPYARAIAAGYKAAMLCSGIFNAGRSEQQIAADELNGIYLEYDAIVPALTANVDRNAAIVAVAFDDKLPPRYAAWHMGTGCTNLPIGAGAPAGSAPVPPRGADPRRWPQGDTGIAPKPSARLARVVENALDRTSYGKDSETVAVLIVRDGRIVAERYRDGFGPFVSNRTWSVAKSISGTLIGLATGERDNLVDSLASPAPLAPGIAALSMRTGPDSVRGTVTLDHLLRMASGLHSDSAGNRSDAIYFGGTAVDEQTVYWPLEAAPGTRFRYANNDILLAIYAMRQALGEQRYKGYPQRLFDRLGMAHTIAETDWRGNYILSSQVWSTARDLARLGLLWLGDGIWQDERILPDGWVRYMTTPSGPQPADGPGYGATMWLFGPAQGLPAGSYAAQGNRGQYVMVIPSRRLVIVRRAEDPGAARFDIARFSADIIAALE